MEIVAGQYGHPAKIGAPENHILTTHPNGGCQYLRWAPDQGARLTDGTRQRRSVRLT
jgi:hypothetical protein